MLPVDYFVNKGVVCDKSGTTYRGNYLLNGGGISSALRSKLRSSWNNAVQKLLVVNVVSYNA